jgi:hypothetical protein
MSEFGLQVWDAQGQLILSGVDETMRIVTTLQVRLGTVGYEVIIPCPPARVGMYGLVQVFHPYTDWPWYGGKVKTRSSTPSIQILDGAIRLYTAPNARFYADVDVIVVAS